MFSAKVMPALRHVAIVSMLLWLLFFAFLMQIRGSQASVMQVLLVSVLLSAATTLGYFVIRWAVNRWEKEQK